MKRSLPQSTLRYYCPLAFLFAMLCAIGVGARVVDDFNDNTKTAWKDFTFVPGLGLPVEAGGQFTFSLPPAGQSLFSASTKTSETFDLVEGRTLEFRVDMVSGNGKDAFAVLAFIPSTSSAGTLGGYAMAKSTTDILITKGINKYFVNEATALKNENITLVLTLTCKGGIVHLTGTILDKDNNNQVIWQKTVRDTPNADEMADGNDDPAVPYTGSGNLVLYCYEDFDASAQQEVYEVIYDNAEAWVLESMNLDDFNDNTKTGWKDFTFVPGLGLPVEAGGQFTFSLPPAGQSLFSASTKTTKTFDLVEDQTLEFRVDVVSGNGKDAFAVMAFIPSTSSAGTLGGYALAKSTTDILITKGINKYFVNEATALKNDNITLVLTMTCKGGVVSVTGAILDKDSNNDVIWRKTVRDTPNADEMADGNDDPAAPYLGSGNFVLYCYEDFDASAQQEVYEVIYDNAEVFSAPQAANTPPIISEVQPDEYGNFLPASTEISFKVTDDRALSNDGISAVLNGQTFTAANGLTITGSGTSRTVKLSGLAANVNYAAVLRAVDADGVSAVPVTLYFDTFLVSNPVIEIEDYNFYSGQFINNPVPIPEGTGPQGDAYANQPGTKGVDYQDTRENWQDVPYRPDDNVRMQHSLDKQRVKFADAGGTAAGVYDYDVGDIVAGEWLNYTRNFTAGTYEVYLREALANVQQGEAILGKVMSDPSQPDQTTRVLGSFLGVKTGFQYRNFPLTDGLGKNKIIVRLSGVTTLKLRQATTDPTDGMTYQNYLVFVPVPDPGIQRAAITDVSPAPGATVRSVNPAISVSIQNRDTSVRPETITLSLNGVTVAAQVTSDANGAKVDYSISPLPPSGASNTARLVFTDDTQTTITEEWSFVISYNSLDPANRWPAGGQDRGLQVRVVQAPQGSGLENSLARAEDQLAPNSTIPVFMTTNVVEQVINQNQLEGSQGYFENDNVVPGIDDFANGTDDFAVEIKAYLDLPAGVHRFGVVTDDGYKVVSGTSLDDMSSPSLAYHNGGAANETFDFVVSKPGLYPFRLVWYERGGAAHAEWFSVDTGTGERTLINDPSSGNAIKAYATVQAPPAVAVESTTRIGAAFTTDATATIDIPSKTITIPKPDGARFYRLRAGEKLTIKSIVLQGNVLVLKY